MSILIKSNKTRTGQAKLGQVKTGQVNLGLGKSNRSNRTFFEPKISWAQKLSSPKIFVDPIFFGPKIYFNGRFFNPIFVGPKIHLRMEFDYGDVPQIFR